MHAKHRGVIDVCTRVIVKHTPVIDMRTGVIDGCMGVIVKHTHVIGMYSSAIAVGGGAIAGIRLLGVVLGFGS